MKPPKRGSWHARSSEAALVLIRAMETDLREIRVRVSMVSGDPEAKISPEDNADLNTIQREIRSLMKSVAELPS